VPEIIQGFSNMLATIKVGPKDRAYNDPSQASRPFSLDRKGFVLSEGAGVLVLAAEDKVKSLGLQAKAEIAGIGWTSDAHHFTRPNATTIIRAIQAAIDDAEVSPEDIGSINAHGTSTPTGDATEVECLREVFGKGIGRIPITANKSQVGHSLGASAAIEAALSIEAMSQGLLLPTVNHIPDPAFDDLDLVPNQARKASYEHVLSNSFGFGGTNCCIIFKGRLEITTRDTLRCDQNRLSRNYCRATHPMSPIPRAARSGIAVKCEPSMLTRTVPRWSIMPIISATLNSAGHHSCGRPIIPIKRLKKAAISTPSSRPSSIIIPPSIMMT
jgi:acyl transferase domain-containing protein